MLTAFDLSSQILLGAVFAAVLAFILLISWRYPRQIFWAVFFFRPLLEMSRLIPEKTELVQAVINGVGVAVPTVLLLVLILHRKIWSADYRLPLAFLVVLLLSASFHEKNLEAGEMLIRILTPVVFLLFPRLVIKSEKDLRTFLHVVGASTIFVLIALYLDRDRTNIHPLFGWVQDIIPLVSGGTQRRLGAVFGVPTMTAYWVFQFFAVAFFLSDTEKSPVRFLYLGIWVILLVPIYLAFSRATWIGCLILFFLYPLVKSGRRRTVPLVLGLVAVAVVALPNIIHRLQDPSTIGYRFSVWSGYIRSLTAGGVKAWLTGMGFADLPEKNVFTGHLYSRGATGLVENSFVFLLAGAGLIAAVVFILIALDLLRRAVWLRKHGATPFVRDFGAWGISLLAVWLVMGMVGDMVTYVVINWYWYAYFGCLLAMWRVQKEAARTGDGENQRPDTGAP